jgi:hypothetical protein
MPDLVTDGDNLGDHLATRSFKQIKGTDIASATNITIGTSGNTFDVTGTTTIQHFDNANWVVGSIISLQFDGVVTLTHNSGGLSGNQTNILLSGDINYTTVAGDVLTFLLHDSTSWQEISKNTIGGTMTSHIIPDTNAVYDIGSASYKIRHLFLSDNSLHIGDVSISRTSANTLTCNGTWVGNVTGNLTGNTSGTAATVTTAAQPAITSVGTLTSLTSSGTITGNLTGNVTGNTSGTALSVTNESQPNITSVGTLTGLTTSGAINLSGNNLDNIQNLIHDTSATATTLDFAQDQLQTISISVNTTFATTGVAIGKSKTIKILNNATLHTLAFPAGWKFVGAKPTDIAASKTAILTVTCFGSADADIVAAYAVEA